jgi:phage terminase large subunit-like protein
VSTHYRVPLHDNGPALWPDYIDTDALESARRESGTPIFNTMYQAEPGGLTGQIIHPDFFRYISDGSIERSFIAESQTYMTVDPAFTDKSSADETAIEVASIHPNGMMYLRFVWHGRARFPSIVETIAGDHRNLPATRAKSVVGYYRPMAIGVESVAAQSGLIDMLEELHPDLPIEKMPVTKDKFSRHLELGADYEFGRILHHPSLMNSSFERQLTQLPAAKNDDMADAAYMLTRYVDGGGAVAGDRPKGFR